MTIAEKENIVKYNDFIKLRELLGMTKSHNIYRNEYEKAHKKFNILKEHPTFNFQYLIKNSTTKWDETEWGIPKGRKQSKEQDMNCAIREFIEETNININNIKVLYNLKPIVEEYVSINNIKYKHIYYFAEHINTNQDVDLKVDPDNYNQSRNKCY